MNIVSQGKAAEKRKREKEEKKLEEAENQEDENAAEGEWDDATIAYENQWHQDWPEELPAQDGEDETPAKRRKGGARASRPSVREGSRRKGVSAWGCLGFAYLYIHVYV